MTPEQAWQELLDKDDRTSPEDCPEMCLITFDELRGFLGELEQKHDDYVVAANANVCELNRIIARLRAAQHEADTLHAKALENWKRCTGQR